MCRYPPWSRVNMSKPNLCDHLLKSGQANTPPSAVAKRLASCSAPLSHALPGLIGFICIMYMDRVHLTIMQVIDKRSGEWPWKVMQDAQIHLHTIRWTHSVNNCQRVWKKGRKQTERVRKRATGSALQEPRREIWISFSLQLNPVFCWLASSQYLTSWVT